MTTATVIVLAIVVFGWSIVSERLAARDLTRPPVCVVAGLLLANSSRGIVTVDVESSTVHLPAELTLALLLFADASVVPLAAARQDLPLTSRRRQRQTSTFRNQTTSAPFARTRPLPRERRHSPCAVLRK
jgi:sodium/hydrogen antiporter